MPSIAPSSPSTPWPDQAVFDRNRACFTTAQLAPYDGQWVAFSNDGSRLIAGAGDLLQLKQLVEAAGVDPNEVWLESVLIEQQEMPPSEFFE